MSRAAIKRGHPHRSSVRTLGSTLAFGDTLGHYDQWPAPKVIVSDGPYGLRSFPGETGVSGLVDFYQPHIEAWGRHVEPSTTLWFWCSEIGWATVHGLLEAHGWKYVRACVWDKGASHVAGNANTRTLRQLPAVTELCVQYVREVALPHGETREYLPLKKWLRAEWQRAGLPLSLSNEVAGVRNAATRKWFTQDHLWYPPDGKHFERLVTYANEHGAVDGHPYFSADGARPMTASEWDALRPTFHCPPDVHNVWHHPPVRGAERLRIAGPKAAHMNQKPLALISQLIQWTSDPGDVIWEPFAGTATALVAATGLERRAYGAEINPDFFDLAAERLNALPTLSFSEPCPS